MSDLVGRGQELALLDRVLDAVAAGEPGFLAVAGEPGIGKTSVMEHLCELARGRAAGSCSAGDAGGALERAAAAATAAERAGARRDAAHARLLAGRALAGRGDTDAATRELTAAEAELDAAGAWRRREEAAQELRRLGHPGRAAAAPRDGSRRAPGSSS